MFIGLLQILLLNSQLHICARHNTFTGLHRKFRSNLHAP